MILEAIGISKNFDGIRALDKVDFSLRKGEVHALLGENGAGKSTLLNILSGAIRPDAGHIMLSGKEVSIRTPGVARKLGIVKVHQELQLIPEMTVAQNIFLGYEQLKGGLILDYKSMRKKSREILDSLHVTFKETTQVKNLSTAQMQMVEIAKALLLDFSILALDEPTSSLTDKEIEELFQTIARLKKIGKSIIYISHRLEEIFRIADRVTVLRDGKFINTDLVVNQTKDSIVRMMVGRDIGQLDEAAPESSDKVILSVKNLSNGKNVKDVSFDLHEGEILGIAGLVGAGRTEMVRLIFGADHKVSGTIQIEGETVNIISPKMAIDHGIMLIPEDRKLQGLIGHMSIKDNVVLSSLESFTKLGIIQFNETAKSAESIVDSLSIVPNNISLPTRNLSGGNQQKVVVGKALNVNPEILILDEPTRGIDVKTKMEIYKLMFSLANQGISIIMISSELPEILLMSSRILVMYEGEITGIVTKENATEEKIMYHAMGGTGNYEESN